MAKEKKNKLAHSKTGIVRFMGVNIVGLQIVLDCSSRLAASEMCATTRKPDGRYRIAETDLLARC